VKVILSDKSYIKCDANIILDNGDVVELACSRVDPKDNPKVTEIQTKTTDCDYCGMSEGDGEGAGGLAIEVTNKAWKIQDTLIS